MKLGLKPFVRDPKGRDLMLRKYLKAGAVTPAPSSDWRPTIPQRVLRAMLGNGPDPGNPAGMPNGAGDCFWAAAVRMINAWTAASGTCANLGTADAIAAYSACCGFDPNATPDALDNNPTDVGTDPTQGLKYLASTGIAGHKIGGYVFVDPNNYDEQRFAIDVFGSVMYGVQFPRAWETDPIWNVTYSIIVGGHAVPAFAQNCAAQLGVEVTSWGTQRLLTPAAIAVNADVVVAMFSPDWMNADGQSPDCLDKTAMLADLQAVKQ